MCDVTHSYVWHDSSINDTAHSHVWLFLIQKCDISHSKVWHDSFPGCCIGYCVFSGLTTALMDCRASCVHVYVCVRMHAQACARASARVCVHARVRVYVYVCVRVLVRACACVYTFECVYVCQDMIDQISREHQTMFSNGLYVIYVFI